MFTSSKCLPRNLRPSRSGIDRRHARADLLRLLAEVLLTDFAVLVDDKRHHAAVTAFGGRCDHREPGDHAAGDHIGVRAASRGPYRRSCSSVVLASFGANL